jgi:hypothetical protein
MDGSTSINKDIVREIAPRSNLHDCFREGFLALQQHFQGRRDLDAVDGLKAGIAIGTTVGTIWLMGLFLFALL